eukprot:scaffold18435_cov113-Isochrysis_galbana.AAC.12
MSAASGGPERALDGHASPHEGSQEVRREAPEAVNALASSAAGVPTARPAGNRAAAAAGCPMDAAAAAGGAATRPAPECIASCCWASGTLLVGRGAGCWGAGAMTTSSSPPWRGRGAPRLLPAPADPGRLAGVRLGSGTSPGWC